MEAVTGNALFSRLEDMGPTNLTNMVLLAKGLRVTHLETMCEEEKAIFVTSLQVDLNTWRGRIHKDGCVVSNQHSRLV